MIPGVSIRSSWNNIYDRTIPGTRLNRHQIQFGPDIVLDKSVMALACDVDTHLTQGICFRYAPTFQRCS